MRNVGLVCGLLLSVCLMGRSQGDELLFPNSDFETGTLEGWTAEGEAFVDQPTKGDNSRARNRETANVQGEWWIGGFERYTGAVGQPGATRGDQPTGTLTSQPFTIRRPYISFRIGAGNLPGEVGVRLLVGDERVELATGIDSETMVPYSANVRQYVGREARLQVFDAASGGWGHINVDDFRGTDQPVVDTSKEFALADGITATSYPDVGYDQRYRPQFHFVSKRNWLNDPNGMVYDGRRYHLFFQHNPLATVWGNMTWGHATSPDMVHWTQQPHALLPYRVDRRSGTIFSGTAVVDHNNRLGVQEGDTKTLCAFFTFAAKPAFYQAMAYSTDGGATWKYWNEGRPVVENQGFNSGERDPKVFWHEPSKQWVMVLWVQRDPGRIRFFTSDNLVDWQFASDLMRDWAFECMDLLPLAVDGDEQDTKWLLYDASFDYEIGQFDGQRFVSETPALKMGRGNFYAAQTFNNAPEGRAVQMGWMRGGPNSATHYGVPHNQQMSFPYELQLRTTPKGVRLFCWPIQEINKLVQQNWKADGMTLEPGANALKGVGELDLVDLEVLFSPGDAQQVVFDLPRVTLRYDTNRNSLFHTGVNDQAEPVEVMTIDEVPMREGMVWLRILVDRLSVEAFVGGGRQFGAYYIDPRSGPDTIAMRAEGGKVKVHSLTVQKLESAW